MTKASIQAVAKEAGVSVSTVSRTFAKPDLENRKRSGKPSRQRPHLAPAQEGIGMTANNLNDDWWKQAVVYQIYPRSFKDVNGDGIGDIAGVTEKMDYLKSLGVDAIWLSPFYPSDLADGGYDVIDYRNVDPRLGTMEDFDAMAKAAHEAGIKVIVDIVPNHTADKHVFFQEALAAEPGSPVALPDGSVVLASGPLTPEGQLPTDTSAWVIK